MSETKFELRQPLTPASVTLREGQMATPTVISIVERLEATNANLLAALAGLVQYWGRIVVPAAVLDAAREAIKQAKDES